MFLIDFWIRFVWTNLEKVRYGLSAGRVQSPALRIIMEREREIRAFKSETFYILSALLKHKMVNYFYLRQRNWDKAEVEKILEIAKRKAWSVIDIKESEQARNPRPPFTTSTLQQSASTRLGFAPSRTMGIAQNYTKRFYYIHANRQPKYFQRSSNTND